MKGANCTMPGTLGTLGTLGTKKWKGANQGGHWHPLTNYYYYYYLRVKGAK